jgi:hypothetical protein
MSSSPTASVFFGRTLDIDTDYKIIERIQDEAYNVCNESAKFSLMISGTYDDASEYAIGIPETIQDFTWYCFKEFDYKIFSSNEDKYLEWEALLEEVASKYEIKYDGSPKWLAGVLYG